MKIGAQNEIKNHEYHVGLTPASMLGHDALVQKGTGRSNEQYLAAGAQRAPDAATVFAESAWRRTGRAPLH